jgi:hypothetical protein
MYRYITAIRENEGKKKNGNSGALPNWCWEPLVMTFLIISIVVIASLWKVLETLEH